MINNKVDFQKIFIYTPRQYNGTILKKYNFYISIQGYYKNKFHFISLFFNELI